MNTPPPDSQGPGRLRPSRTSPKATAAARGGFRELRAFQTTTVIYAGTVPFCEKFIRSHKLSDQLIGAARSGRQNIGEGSRAGYRRPTEKLALT